MRDILRASAAKNLTQRLRFGQMPTFGRTTIRKISANVSAMKQFAARNFEEVLKVRTLHGVW